jgi:hypothetical protein
MPNNQTARGRAQDRCKVAGGQEHKVRYEAVKSAGNSRSQVEDKLSKG